MAYYLLWLAAGLLSIAAVSAAITHHWRLRVLRRLKLAELQDALARYSEWMASQRRAAFFQGESQEDGGAADEIGAVTRDWFPELRAETHALLAVHARLTDFLAAQQSLRLQDPEAWLEADQDARFMELWRQHIQAAHALGDKLSLAPDTQEAGHGPGTTFPA